MKVLRIAFEILGFLTFLALVALVYINREARISFDLGLVSLDQVPASVVLLGCLLGGSILSLLFALPEWIRLRLLVRELRGEGSSRSLQGNDPSEPVSRP